MAMFNAKSNLAYLNDRSKFHGISRHFMEIVNDHILKLLIHHCKIYVQSVKKKTKHPYLFQYKLSYRKETGTNHHGLLSTSV